MLFKKISRTASSIRLKKALKLCVTASAFLLFTAITLSCSKTNFTRTSTDEYSNAFKLFNLDLQAINEPTIDFSELKVEHTDLSYRLDNALATCERNRKQASGPAKISLDPRARGLAIGKQTALIYHEILHCYYKKKHQKGHEIMNADVIDIITDDEFKNAVSRVELLRRAISLD